MEFIKRPYSVEPLYIFPYSSLYTLEKKKLKRITSEIIKTEKKLKRIIEKDGKFYLPKGTVLYHGSILSDLDFHIPKMITFFGLEPDLCLWYIHELIKSQWFFQNNKIGFLYIYTLNKDLLIDNILEDFYHHPSDPKDFFSLESECENKVCMHPQIAVRVGYKDYSEFYIEISIAMNKYRNYLDLSDICIVDASILEKNKKKIDWDPINSIIACKKIKDIKRNK